jgi:ElaB/YqjD/DUF883 family membrane-anchored ribosome-binding protein
MGKNPNNLSEAIRRLESATHGNGNGQSVTEDLDTLKRAFSNLKDDLVKSASDKINDGKETAREFGQSVDKRVHENPWMALGIVGVVAFLIGFLIGRKD